MSDNQTQNVLDDMNITLNFPVKAVNILLNLLNLPQQAPTTLLSEFINAIQLQANPQIQEAQAGLEAALAASANATATTEATGG